jgi:N-acetylmuramic acid 6-phosphate (MurNAc-6-P) etherase
MGAGKMVVNIMTTTVMEKISSVFITPLVLLHSAGSDDQQRPVYLLQYASSDTAIKGSV